MAQKANTTVRDIYEYDKHLLHAKIVHQVVTMEATLKELKEFIEDMSDGKLEPSMSTVNNYRLKIKEADETNTDFFELIDKRNKNGKIVDIADKKVDDNIVPMASQVPRQTTEEGTLDVISILTPMEKMISKGLKGLDMVEVIDPALLLKVISEYSKITGNANGGLTLSGLQQIVLQVKAKEAANAEVIFKYIPEEQHENVLADMKRLEEDFYNNLDLTEQGRSVKKTLEQLNITI